MTVPEQFKADAEAYWAEKREPMTPESIPSGALKVAELLPCPHCNHKTAPVLTTSTEWAEESDLPVDEFDGNGESYSVMCDAHKPGGPGGCGACSGFRASEAEAIEAWNRRASPSPATGALSEEFPCETNTDFVAVRRYAIEWLKTHYPALTVKAGLCESIGGRLYTRTALSSAKREAEPQEADPIDSDEHLIWIAILGWLNSEGSDSSVAAVNAAIKVKCAKREAEPLTDDAISRLTAELDCDRIGWAIRWTRTIEAAHGITAASQVEPEDKHG